ncbi:MAG: hypothetical protein R2813_09280 [Flavobacteriales bacterium]
MPHTYKFSPPAIPSAGVYYFQTDAHIKYEVRFGRKQNDILSVNLVFGVLNDEFGGDEYALVNKGEFYSVMQTIEAIIQDFFLKNPNVHSFEFAGEPSDSNEDSEHITKRTRVYLRYARKIFLPTMWKTTLNGNKVFIERKR